MLIRLKKAGRDFAHKTDMNLSCDLGTSSDHSHYPYIVVKWSSFEEAKLHVLSRPTTHEEQQLCNGLKEIPLGGEKARSGQHKHHWVKIGPSQAKIWHCSKSSKCSKPIVVACDDPNCLGGYCVDHIFHAPQISRKLGLSIIKDKK